MNQIKPPFPLNPRSAMMCLLMLVAPLAMADTETTSDSSADKAEASKKTDSSVSIKAKTTTSTAKAEAVKKNNTAVLESKKNQPTDNTAFELGEVFVSPGLTSGLSKKMHSRDISSSVDIMNADKIQNQNVLTSYDLFQRMPGVQITQFNQGITTGKFSFRGFNGEGNINAVKLLIDGIPSNTNDGNMPFIDALFPLDIESIEVVRGTNDPRYGLHAIAGNANVTTALGGNYVKGRTFAVTTI